MRALLLITALALAAAATAGAAVAVQRNKQLTDRKSGDANDDADIIEAEEVSPSEGGRTPVDRDVVSSPGSVGKATTPAELVRVFGLPTEVAAALVEVATEVGAKPAHLAAFIHYRTEQTWDPQRNVASGYGLMGWRTPPQVIMLPGVSANDVLRMGAVAQIRGPIRAHLLAATAGTLFDVIGAAGAFATPFRPYAARPVATLHELATAMTFPLYREAEDVDAAFPISVADALGARTPAELVQRIRDAAPAGAL